MSRSCRDFRDMMQYRYGYLEFYKHFSRDYLVLPRGGTWTPIASAMSPAVWHENVRLGCKELQKILEE